MIIIYTTKTWLRYAYFIKRMSKYPINIVTNYNNKIIDIADVVIPIGINAQKELIYRNNKNALVCSNKNIYNQLNDKTKFYNFVTKYNLLTNINNICLIETFGKKYNGPNIFGSFYIKPNGSAASYNNKIKKGYIYDLIKKYRDHQIQDIIDIKQICSINCLCLNGKIISSHNFVTPHSISTNYYMKDHRQYLVPMSEPYISVCNNIVQASGYSGLIEIEFILSNSGKNYLMECNPRLSGNLLCILKNKNSPYIENIIHAYIDVIMKGRVNLVDYNDKVHKLIYKGSFRGPH